MRLDLGGIRVPVEPHRFDKLAAYRGPVVVGVGAEVRIIVAHRAVEFTQHFDCRDLLQLPPYPMHHVGKFLAQGRR